MRSAFSLALMISASGAAASPPTLGGPMSHLLVTLFNNEIFLSFESPSMSTVTMQDNAGDFVAGASVLNGHGYNGQFGWLANGFISLPPSSGIFVRTLASSPHLRVYEESSFESILGTDGADDVWRWDGTMTHNWYATDTHGEHLARYEVFVGDLTGNPLDGYTSSTIELRFEYGQDLSGRIGTLGSGIVSSVPAQGTITIMSAALLFTRRRR
ncbi:MAG: hypothetical protein JJ916_02095 [Phycisphaerales bacterium]|nr:hypothetical protein [Phycisphaerales bacterium]